MELKELYESFNKKETFKPGDIVRWKKGLRNKRTEGPFIVMELIDPPIIEENANAGSPYFREPLDLVLGVIDSDDDFMCHHYDSRRFTKAE